MRDSCARSDGCAVRFQSVDRFAESIAEASARFAVPARWIRTLLPIESGGGELATSPRVQWA
jgi:hypothetical protein